MKLFFVSCAHGHEDGVRIRLSISFLNKNECIIVLYIYILLDENA